MESKQCVDVIIIYLFIYYVFKLGRPYSKVCKNVMYVNLKQKSFNTLFRCDSYFVGDDSDRMAPVGRLGEKRDGATSEHQTFRCGGRPRLYLLLECTSTVPREQGQMETHARTSFSFILKTV